MNVQRGDVVMVDWVYSDRTGSKKCPALVVQADVYNTALDDTILALISSSQRRRVGAASQLVIDVSKTGLSIAANFFDGQWHWRAKRQYIQSLSLGSLKRKPGRVHIVR